jgi:hypothetical protein
MRVIVCGSRHWINAERIRQVMALFPKDTVIVHGACRGADMIADTVAKALGLETEPHPADWERYGRAAGPIRNDRMLLALVWRWLSLFTMIFRNPRAQRTW